MTEEENIPPSGGADRRLRIIVYASLVAFFTLAAYGFYLIYHLTRDIHQTTLRMGILTDTVTKQMTIVAHAMDQIPGPMRSVARDTKSMAHDTRAMAQSTDAMAHTNSYMAETNARMQADMWSLNHSVSSTMAPMTAMMPWGGGGPFPGSGGPMPYPPPYPPPR